MKPLRLYNYTVIRKFALSVNCAFYVMATGYGIDIAPSGIVLFLFVLVILSTKCIQIIWLVANGLSVAIWLGGHSYSMYVQRG